MKTSTVCRVSFKFFFIFLLATCALIRVRVLQRDQAADFTGTPKLNLFCFIYSRDQTRVEIPMKEDGKKCRICCQCFVRFETVFASPSAGSVVRSSVDSSVVRFFEADGDGDG